MKMKELNAKLKELKDNGIVSRVFLNTIGLDGIDGDLATIGNGKKVKCYVNFYCTFCVPPSIQKYIEKGYMVMDQEMSINDLKVFTVTEDGFAWLSKLLGIKVEEIK